MKKIDLFILCIVLIIVFKSHKNIMEKSSAQITNGITSLYDQPTHNEVTIIRQHFHQQTNTRANPEYVITDSILAIQQYPFNISIGETTRIEMKLNNACVSITQNKITSNKPIFMESRNETLRIWNAQMTPHNVISTQGNTYVDGYDILDFDNNNIKVTHNNYNYIVWNIDNFNSIKNIHMRGNENEILIDMALNKDLSIEIIGTNKINIVQNVFDNLKINMTNSTLDLNDSICNDLVGAIKGIGKFNNLMVLSSSNINIIGPTVLALKKNKSTVSKSKISGTGKIIWEINHDSK